MPAHISSAAATATSERLCTQLISFVQSSPPFDVTLKRSRTAAAAVGSDLIDNVDCAIPHSNVLRGIAVARPEDTNRWLVVLQSAECDTSRVLVAALSAYCSRQQQQQQQQAVIAECYGADKRQQTWSIDGRISCRRMKEYGPMNEWVWWRFTIGRPRYTSRQLLVSAYERRG